MIGLLGRLLSGNGGMLSEPQITLVAQMGCDGLCVGSPGIRGAPTSGGVPLQRVCPEQSPAVASLPRPLRAAKGTIGHPLLSRAGLKPAPTSRPLRGWKGWRGEGTVVIR